MRMTRSMMRVLALLREADRPLTPKELIAQLPLAPRTVRYSLTSLLEMGLVKKCPKLDDMRQCIYAPTEIAA